MRCLKSVKLHYHILLYLKTFGCFNEFKLSCHWGKQKNAIQTSTLIKTLIFCMITSSWCLHVAHLTVWRICKKLFRNWHHKNSLFIHCCACSLLAIHATFHFIRKYKFVFLSVCACKRTVHHFAYACAWCWSDIKSVYYCGKVFLKVASVSCLTSAASTRDAR